MNKFNKGKAIGILTASLSAISLMGVGFASWIISGGNSETTGDITVSIADVLDQRVIIKSANVNQEDNSVTFDAAKNGTGDLGITASGNSSEDLTFSITYVVDVYAGLATGDTWNVTAQLTGSNVENYKSAVSTKKYIEMPSTLGLDDAVVAVTNTSRNGTGLSITSSEQTGYKEYTIKQTFSFGWGEAFNKVNPVNVKKNDQIVDGASSKTVATQENVIQNLKALKALELSSFTVKLTSNVNSTTSK